MGCGISKSRARVANDPYYVQLPCTLEELYTGVVKQCRIFKRRNKISTFVETLQIKILPGSSDGHVIVFPLKRDIRPNHIPGDLIIILREQPHPLFTRKGAHLFTTIKLSLPEALAKDCVTVKTLDNRSITIPNIDFNRPEVGIQVWHEGMPHLCDRRIKGILFINIEIDFPKSLTEEQKVKFEEISNMKLAQNNKRDIMPYY